MAFPWLLSPQERLDAALGRAQTAPAAPRITSSAHSDSWGHVAGSRRRADVHFLTAGPVDGGSGRQQSAQHRETKSQRVTKRDRRQVRTAAAAAADSRERARQHSTAGQPHRRLEEAIPSTSLATVSAEYNDGAVILRSPRGQSSRPGGRSAGVSPGGDSAALAGPGRADVRRRPPTPGMGSSESLAEEPWKSPAVSQLVNQMGYTGSVVQPMVIQGPDGRMVLGAVGEVEDHAAAGEYLHRLHQSRAQRTHTARGGSSRHKLSLDSSTAAQRQTRNGQRGKNAASRQTSSLVQMLGGNGGDKPGSSSITFGAVYEYRDAFGKPKIVSSTETVPEAQFVADTQDTSGHHASALRAIGDGVPGRSTDGRLKQFQSARDRELAPHDSRRATSWHGTNGQVVRKLMTSGTPAVVWAGCAREPIGRNEMEGVRRAIVEERSRRLNIAKLRSAKPYSRHGFGDLEDTASSPSRQSRTQWAVTDRPRHMPPATSNQKKATRGQSLPRMRTPALTARQRERQRQLTQRERTQSQLSQRRQEKS